MNLIPGSGRSPREKNATHSNILAWKIPWTEEPGWLQSMGLQKGLTQLTTKQQQYCIVLILYLHLFFYPLMCQWTPGLSSCFDFGMLQQCTWGWSYLLKTTISYTLVYTRGRITRSYGSFKFLRTPYSFP